jgi:hypothetical protein
MGERAGVLWGCFPVVSPAENGEILIDYHIEI